MQSRERQGNSGMSAPEKIRRLDRNSLKLSSGFTVNSVSDTKMYICAMFIEKGAAGK